MTKMNNSEPIIRSERLDLYQFSTRDAAEMYQLNKDDEVMRYTGDSAFHSIKEAKAFIEGYDHYEKYGFGRWTIRRRSDGAYIGWCGLKQHSTYVDLGYRLRKDHWGRGYAPEAALACLDYGFKSIGLASLVGRVASANVASIRVLEKIGMAYWKSDSCEGISDAKYYRITKNDYLK